MSSFRPFVWDPTLIIGQMICMQSTFYAAEAILWSLLRIFEHLSNIPSIFSKQVGTEAILIQILSEIICAFAMVHVVQRSKQCLDFVCTFHLFHLVFVILHNGSFPLKFSWWILQISGITLCTILGEHLCRKYESQVIQLAQSSKYEL